MELSDKTLLKMYEDMLKVRAFEEKADEQISKGVISGTAHLCIGQEGIMVGTGHALKTTDYITITHRGHGHALMKGSDINKMMAELYGREGGLCKGRAGSLHLVDMSVRNIGSNGIVGAGVPIAVGAALALRMKEKDDIVLCSIGDGAMNQGCFHEGLNLSSIWKLPVVFLVENNHYAMSTPVTEAFNINDLSIRAQGYGMKSYSIDGNNVIKVYETVKKATEYARINGPVLIVADTYRWKGHSITDPQRYRTKEEIEEWKKKCPCMYLERILVKKSLLDEEKINQIKINVHKLIDDAAEFANNSPFPDPDTLEDFIYYEEV